MVSEAALAGLPADDLVSLIESEITGEGGMHMDLRRGLPPFYQPVLASALEYPELMRFLLAAGADVNHRHPLGKTALMYAAQFNLPDAVAILLDHGADVELAITTLNNRCYTVVSRGNRTALTYAVEYASLDTIRLLLDAGAKTDVKDSLGNSLLVYLAHNDRLSAAEKAEARALLSNAR